MKSSRNHGVRQRLMKDGTNDAGEVCYKTKGCRH